MGCSFAHKHWSSAARGWKVARAGSLEAEGSVLEITLNAQELHLDVRREHCLFQHDMWGLPNFQKHSQVAFVFIGLLVHCCWQINEHYSLDALTGWAARGQGKYENNPLSVSKCDSVILKWTLFECVGELTVPSGRRDKAFLKNFSMHWALLGASPSRRSQCLYSLCLIQTRRPAGARISLTAKKTGLVRVGEYHLSSGHAIGMYSECVQMPGFGKWQIRMPRYKSDHDLES